MKKINIYTKLGLLLIVGSIILMQFSLLSKWIKIILSIVGFILIVKGNMNEECKK